MQQEVNMGLSLVMTLLIHIVDFIQTFILFYNTVIRLNKIVTFHQYSIIIIILYRRPLYSSRYIIISHISYGILAVGSLGDCLLRYCPLQAAHSINDCPL